MSGKIEKAQAKMKTAPKAVEEETTNLSVGEILRRARTAEDLSLEQVAEHIRIRASMLQAIEDMELDKLPGWIYTVGFVRTYSEFLNLDGDKMIGLLKLQVGDKKRQELNFPVTASESSLPDPWLLGVAAISLIMLVIVVFVIRSFFGGDQNTSSDVNTIPPVPIIEKYAESDVSEPPETETLAQTENTKPAEETFLQAPRDENGVILPYRKPQTSQIPSTLEEYRIVINVTEESWVEISDGSGEILVSRVLKQGDQYYVPQNAKGLTMTTGNVAGISISVDGETINIPGQSGDIKRDIPLEPESLKEMFP